MSGDPKRQVGRDLGLIKEPTRRGRANKKSACQQETDDEGELIRHTDARMYDSGLLSGRSEVVGNFAFRQIYGQITSLFYPNDVIHCVFPPLHFQRTQTLLFYASSSSPFNFPVHGPGWTIISADGCLMKILYERPFHPKHYDNIGMLSTVLC